MLLQSFDVHECDIIATSETGSGKTLAYLLPALDLWLKHGLQTHILTSNNLLVNQIRQTIFDLLKNPKFDENEEEKFITNPYSIIGMAKKKNASIVKTPIGITIPPITISTLGNFNPAFAHKSFLVIDEADKIFNM